MIDEVGVEMMRIMDKTSSSKKMFAIEWELTCLCLMGRDRWLESRRRRRGVTWVSQDTINTGMEMLLG